LIRHTDTYASSYPCFGENEDIARNKALVNSDLTGFKKCDKVEDFAATEERR